MRRWAQIGAGFALLAAGFLYLYRSFVFYVIDPDRFYHFAVSRATVESGHWVLRALPQVEGLHWNEYFLDKEFLFHQFTILGYRLAGDPGVAAIAVMISLAAIGAFLVASARRLTPGAAVALSGLVFFTPFLAYRLLLLRPHTLAILAFVLTNFALLARRPRLTALAAAFFTLSYHAFYVPVAGFVWLLVVSAMAAREERRQWRRVALAGLFGCVVGILLNPYFPANLVMAVVQAKVPGLLKNELRTLSFGVEAYPLSSDEFLDVFWLPVLAIAGGLLALGADLAGGWRPWNERRTKLLYCLGGCALFLALAMQTKRAGEYLVPIAGVMLVVTLEGVRNWRARYTALIAFLALGQAAHLVRTWRAQDVTRQLGRGERTLAAVAAIPPEAKGKKVFNCDWDRSPFLMHARPDLRFVDLLDPSLLYFADPMAFRAKQDLLDGRVADARGMIHGGFKADYVLCGDQGLIEQIRVDPGFRLLHPSRINGIVPEIQSLFVVVPEPAREYVRRMDLRQLREIAPADVAELRPGRERLRVVSLEPSVALNLEPLIAEIAPPRAPGSLHCAMVSPSAEEVKRLAGATYLGLGGGQGFQVWRNGAPEFATPVGYSRARSVQVLVPLATPLRAGDEFQVLVCSPAHDAYWSLALSFWTDAGITEACKTMANPSAESKAALSWRLRGSERRTCLGPVAVPRVSSVLR